MAGADFEETRASKERAKGFMKGKGRSERLDAKAKKAMVAEVSVPDDLVGLVAPLARGYRSLRI